MFKRVAALTLVISACQHPKPLATRAPHPSSLPTALTRTNARPTTAPTTRPTLPEPVARLLERLTSPDDWTVGRLRAVAELVGLGPQAATAIPALRKILQAADDSGVKEAAALALSRLGDLGVAVLLEQATQSKSAAREPSLKAIRGIDVAGVSSARILSRFAAALDGPDRDLREAVVDALKRGMTDYLAPRFVSGLSKIVLQGKGGYESSSAVDALGNACLSCTATCEPLVPAIAALRYALGSRNQTTSQMVRFGATQALGKLGRLGQPAIPDLERVLLHDPSEAVRELAAEALGRIDSAGKAVRSLRRALRDHNAKVRAEAATALGRIGHTAVLAAGQLRRLLRDKEASVRAEAATALGKIGDRPAARRLGRLLSDTELRVQIAALGALKRLGLAAKRALPFLLKALDADPGHREQLFAVIEKMAAVPALKLALRHSKENIRSGAAATLGRLGSRAAGAMTQLRKAMSDSSPQVRSWSIWALARISKPARAIVMLETALTDQASDVRRAVVWRLADLPAALRPKAKSFLRRLLNDTELKVRANAAIALVRLGYPLAKALPILRQALDSPQLRASAGSRIAALLASHGKEASSAAPQLELLCRTSRYDIAGAARALWKVGHADQAIKHLKRALERGLMQFARAEAATVLGEIATRDSIKMLRKALDDPSVDVRTAAAVAMVKIGRFEPAASVLRQSIDTCGSLLNDNVSNRIQAARALASVGKRASWVVPRLKRATRDTAPEVRAAAAAALRRLSCN